MSLSIRVCAVCSALFEAERSDALACGGACRIRGLRNGCLKTLRQSAAAWDVPPGMVLQARAVQLLRPDLETEIKSGRLTVEDAQPAVRREFAKRVWLAIGAAAAAPLPAREVGNA
jgi:hypothetical protein